MIRPEVRRSPSGTKSGAAIAHGMKGTLRHVFTVGGLTAFSRVLGLVREMLQSRLIGAGVEQSAFALAFAIPNMARKLFGEGALTAAFVPVFKGEVEREGLAKAERLARAVVTMMLLMLAAILTLVFLGLFGVAQAPCFAGLREDPYRFRITFRLVSVLLPYMLAICGAAFGMGVLNALGKFKASSFMPALLNVIWIAALAALLFFPSMPLDRRVVWVAGAILLGGFLQLAFMFRCMAKVGVRPLPSFSGWRSEKVRIVWRNTAIAAVGAGAVQINYMLDQVLAQYAAPWAAGVIGYAERLMDLPLGVIGVAFGTVLLPTFSGCFARGDAAAAKEALASSFRNMMTVMLPAGFGLFVLAPEITAVIYEGNAFDAVATVRVARALAVYALGLGFFGCQKILVPWFQSQNDMKTPLRVSVCTVVVNAALNIAAVVCLPVEWRHVGLAVSTVFCAGLGCAILRTLAVRRNGPLCAPGTVAFLVKVCLASAVMAGVLVFLKPCVRDWSRILALGVLVAAGVAAYAALALSLGIARKLRVGKLGR